MLDIVSSKNLILPHSAEAWLHELKGSTVVEIAGADSKQWRVVSVLVHGNEPSGFIAAFNFLKEKIVPNTNLAMVIASVRAARHQPLFTHRHMPGEFDLNRRFGQPEIHDRVTELARYVAEYIRSKTPQLVVDLHNTSGEGPAFAVSVSDHPTVKKIATFFTQEMVVTQLIVGSLMEQNFNCPIVTIECGGAGDTKSHALAYEGLCRLMACNDIDGIDHQTINVHCHPTRIAIHSGISLHYGQQADPEVDVTLVNNIELFNYKVLKKGTTIGWLGRPLKECFSAINDHGVELIQELFTDDNGKLIARSDMQLFMATPRADLALEDCAFYAVAGEL